MHKLISIFRNNFPRVFFLTVVLLVLIWPHQTAFAALVYFLTSDDALEHIRQLVRILDKTSLNKEGDGEAHEDVKEPEIKHREVESFDDEEASLLIPSDNIAGYFQDMEPQQPSKFLARGYPRRSRRRKIRNVRQAP
ncbi:hypothetical protein KW782_04320 [Candidatus Parcubacteria bacterium]|nr:hypothetical protein [Candidatus Parcubacteria bacterium]